MIRTPVLLLAVALASSGVAMASSAHASDDQARHRTVQVAKKKVPPPMKLVVSERTGPKAGEATLSWRQLATSYATRTTSFRIETSLTRFSPYGGKVPRKGRHWHAFVVGSTKRQLVLGPDQLGLAGAKLGSGNDIYWRIFSLDAKKAGESGSTRVWSDGKMRIATVLGRAPSGREPLTVATYNVRGEPFDSAGSAHAWSKRKPLVGQTILDNAPDVVALQEAMPEPYGQAADLQSWIAAHQGAGHDYRLVRAKRYSSIAESQQGPRILYDASRYTLVSSCPDVLNGDACTIALPRLNGDPASRQRWAAYARFQSVTTHRAFWVVSVHFDERNSSSPSAQKTYNNLRLSMVQTVASWITDHTSGEPVIVAGDFNDWQNDQAPLGNSAHDYLVAHGYYDTAAAVQRTNFAYPTVNHFEGSTKSADGVGFRYDMILTRGMPGAARETIVVSRPGGEWPSDHNMVLAQLALP